MRELIFGSAEKVNRFLNNHGLVEDQDCRNWDCWSDIHQGIQTCDVPLSKNDKFVGWKVQIFHNNELVKVELHLNRWV